MRAVRLAAALALAVCMTVALASCAPASSAEGNAGASSTSGAAAGASADVRGGVGLQGQDAASQRDTGESKEEEPMLAIIANGATFIAVFEDDSSARALADYLRRGPLVLSLRDYGNFEKVGPLGTTLPTNDASVTTQPGDVILYQGNQLTIYYDENTWSFTRLAHIDGATREGLLSAFGESDVEVTLELR